MKTITNVIVYTTSDGQQPLQKYFSTLDPWSMSKILLTIELLEAHGRDYRGKLVKSLKYNPRYKDMFEIKFHQERIIFKYYGMDIVLFWGFTKKSDKTPRNELEKARQYRIDYERRLQN